MLSIAADREVKDTVFRRVKLLPFTAISINLPPRSHLSADRRNIEDARFARDEAPFGISLCDPSGAALSAFLQRHGIGRSSLKRLLGDETQPRPIPFKHAFNLW